MPNIITIVSSNLNDYGNNGTFESAYSPPSWGTYFNSPSIYDQTITRSSTVAHSGTYSARAEMTDTSYGQRAIIPTIAHHTASGYKKYQATCWVYIPSSNPCTSTSSRIKLSRSGGAGVSVYANLMAFVQYNTWLKVEARFQSSVNVSADSFLTLEIDNNQTLIANGYCYVDDFNIYEITETVAEYDISAAITNASGPSQNDGAITLSGLPTAFGPYQYSITGGTTFGGTGSGTFTGLYPGSYSCAIRQPLGAPLVYKTFVIGNAPLAFDFTVTSTNETSAGAGDGTITATVTGTGAPFTYRLRGPGSSPTGSGFADTGYVSGNVFTSLEPGYYRVTVKDTNGNTKTRTVTIVSAPTCVLGFDQDLTVITDSSEEGATDGSIQVVASDPIYGGTTYYKLNSDFTYPVGDNTTGFFENLLAGVYTIYARTSERCLVFGSFEIKNASAYGVRYRLEFNAIARNEFIDRNGQTVDWGANNQFRLDIEERGFDGSITEVIGSANPVIHSWRGEAEENPFALTVVGSELVVNLLSPSNLYFSDLYTSDEKKFRFKFYLYDQWTDEYGVLFQGFPIPMNFSEPYVSRTNYPVTFQCSDGLRDLESKEFSDDAGNYIEGRISVLQALAICLRKTGHRLNIYDKVNLYCEGMLTSESDGALTQRYFDTRVYKNTDGTFKSCLYVLQNLLKGCHLYQAAGAWHIELITEKCSTNVQVQVYDYKGVYQSNFIQNNRLKWRNPSALAPRLITSDQPTWNLAQTYGNVKVTFDLQLEQENNLLDYGKFESVDLSNGQLLGWTINKGEGDVTTEIIQSPGRSDDTCLSIRFNVAVVNEYVDLISNDVNFLYDSEKRLRLSFDVYTIPVVTNTYVFFDIRLYLKTNDTIFYITPTVINFDTGYPDFVSGGGMTPPSTLLTDGWYRVYVDDHLQWKTFNFETVLEDFSPAVYQGVLKVEFRIHPNDLYDVDQSTDLEDVVTTGYPARNFDNRRRWNNAVAPNEFIYHSTLEVSDAAASIPDVVEPNDMSGSPPQYKWILKSTITSDPDWKSWLQNILIDNVQIGYFPNNTDPITEIPREEVINTNVPNTIEETTLHGDVYYSEDLDLGEFELDPNYEKLSFSYWSLQDGTVTRGGWFRRGVTENKFYHELLAKMIRGQFSIPRWRIAGDFVTRQKLIDFTNTIHEVRSGRVYLPLSLSIDYKNETCSAEIRESVKGEAIDDDGTVDVVDIPEPEPSDDNGGETGGSLGQHSIEHSPEHD